MFYVISEKYGTVYWKEDGVVCYCPMNTDNTFDTEEGGQVETWDEIDPAEMERALKLLVEDKKCGHSAWALTTHGCLDCDKEQCNN